MNPALEAILHRQLLFVRMLFFFASLSVVIFLGAACLVPPFDIDQLHRFLGASGTEVDTIIVTVLAAGFFALALALMLFRMRMLNPRRAGKLGPSVRDLWQIFVVKVTHDEKMIDELQPGYSALGFILSMQRLPLNLDRVTDRQEALLFRYLVGNAFGMALGPAVAAFGFLLRLVGFGSQVWLSFAIGAFVALLLFLPNEGTLREGIRRLDPEKGDIGSRAMPG